MFITAAVHMLDLSPIWQALAIRRALDRVARALTSMSKERVARTQWIPRFICRASGLGPDGLLFVVNGRVRKLFPFRRRSVQSHDPAFSISRHGNPTRGHDLTALFGDHIQALIIYLRV